MSLGLSPKQLVGIARWLVGSPVVSARLDVRSGCGCGVPGVHADGERTAAPATRLALLVEEGLGFGPALLLLQSALLAQRRADDAAALLADPTAVVCDLLLALLRELRLVWRCGAGAVMRRAV